MTKYHYRNDKHVVLHGIKPGDSAWFDRVIPGGGITLLEKKDESVEKKKFNKSKKTNKEMI